MGLRPKAGTAGVVMTSAFGQIPSMDRFDLTSAATQIAAEVAGLT